MWNGGPSRQAAQSVGVGAVEAGSGRLHVAEAGSVLDAAEADGVRPSAEVGAADAEDMRLLEAARREVAELEVLLAKTLRALARVDGGQGGANADAAVAVAASSRPLPPLPHELWLLILQFVPRRQLGRW